MLRAPRERVAQWALLVRADARLRLMTAGGAVLAVVLVGAGLFWACRPAAGPGAAAPEQQWRYLLVCEGCGYRTRMVEHPAHVLAKENGLLQCPKCGAYRAAWYRRGSLSLPPGGWSTSQPAANPAIDGPADGGMP